MYASDNFCAVYLLYWAFAIPMIRYAIAPIAILLLLMAGAVVDFCRSMNRAVVSSVLLASVYVLLFSTCGIAINEINGPQLRYFAGRIDRRQYLREALLPYRSLEYLMRVALPGESIFGVDACALAYAPNPEHFDCMLVTPSNRGLLKQTLIKLPQRFVILPRAYASDAPAGWETVFSDPVYHVYRKDLEPR